MLAKLFKRSDKIDIKWPERYRIVPDEFSGKLCYKLEKRILNRDPLCKHNTFGYSFVTRRTTIREIKEVIKHLDLPWIRIEGYVERN